MGLLWMMALRVRPSSCAVETAALILGILFSPTRFFRFLPEAQKQVFLKTLSEEAA
jgi:hypothetical protein